MLLIGYPKGIFNFFSINFFFKLFIFFFFFRLLAQRDGVITQQVVLVAYGEAKDKVKENNERDKKEKKSNTLGESSAFAILYNNLFFLVAFLTIAFYILPNVPGPYNYAISVLSSASLVAFVSQEALKRA